MPALGASSLVTRHRSLAERVERLERVAGLMRRMLEGRTFVEISAAEEMLKVEMLQC